MRKFVFLIYFTSLGVFQTTLAIGDNTNKMSASQTCELFMSPIMQKMRGLTNKEATKKVLQKLRRFQENILLGHYIERPKVVPEVYENLYINSEFGLEEYSGAVKSIEGILRQERNIENSDDKIETYAYEFTDKDLDVFLVHFIISYQKYVEVNNSYSDFTINDRLIDYIAGLVFLGAPTLTYLTENMNFILPLGMIPLLYLLNTTIDLPKRVKKSLTSLLPEQFVKKMGEKEKRGWDYYSFSGHVPAILIKLLKMQKDFNTEEELYSKGDIIYTVNLFDQLEHGNLKQRAMITEQLKKLNYKKEDFNKEFIAIDVLYDRDSESLIVVLRVQEKKSEYISPEKENEGEKITDLILFPTPQTH